MFLINFRVIPAKFINSMSSQKKLRSLKYSPFDSLIENRKFQKNQLHSSSGPDFMAILRIFHAKFGDKM